MAENKVAAGPVNGAGGVREAVCVHTRKIYSSVRDKDCIEDLRFYPTENAQSILQSAQSVRGGRVELLYTYVDVEPVNFNRGYYTVDMRFYYRVVLQVMNGGPRYTEVEGLSTFAKRVILYGSEGGAKRFTSVAVPGAPDFPPFPNVNMPLAVVEAVDPLLLSAKIVDPACQCGYDNLINGVPPFILDAFGDPLVFDENGMRKICISIGQFSITRLERDTQLLIPACDYCIPSEESDCGATDGISSEDPCEMFDGVAFPVDEFFPPNENRCSCDNA